MSEPQQQHCRWVIYWPADDSVDNCGFLQPVDDFVTYSSDGTGEDLRQATQHLLTERTPEFDLEISRQSIPGAVGLAVPCPVGMGFSARELRAAADTYRAQHKEPTVMRTAYVRIDNSMCPSEDAAVVKLTVSDTRVVMASLFKAGVYHTSPTMFVSMTVAQLAEWTRYDSTGRPVEDYHEIARHPNGPWLRDLDEERLRRLLQREDSVDEPA